MIKKHLFLGIFISLLLIVMGCRASRILFPDISKGDDNWLKKESKHYHIYYRPGSLESWDTGDVVSKTLDSCFEYVLVQLEVNFSGKISYYLYDSAEDLEQWGGWHKWGFFIGDMEYAVGVYNSQYSTVDAHETVHIIACYTIGVGRLAFLEEGLAHEITNSNDRFPSGKLALHKRCKQLLYQNALFSLEVLADNSRFKDIYNSSYCWNYYDQSGSFVKYLIDQYGLSKFKILLPLAGEDNYKRIFQEIYGSRIEDFEIQWKQFLRNY